MRSYYYTAENVASNVSVANTNTPDVSSLPAGTQTTPTYAFYSYSGNMGIGTTSITGILNIASEANDFSSGTAIKNLCF